MRIDINEVEKALLNLLNELRNQRGDAIEIEPVDYYWTIDREELYNPYNDPTHLTLGQLTDDLEEIKKLADNGAAPIAQDLVKISSVLAALGHKTVW